MGGNGQNFYVNFGDNSEESEGIYRSWEDARRYGFVSAGGKRWFSKSMENLFPGARVFVNIPKYGYVGIGEVIELACPVNEFMVDHEGQNIPLLEAPLTVKDPKRMAENADDPEKRELFVRVKWTKTIPKQDAFWEKGMFAIQLSACKLRNRFTLDKLTEHFDLNE